jgi:hypothetical protein
MLSEGAAIIVNWREVANELVASSWLPLTNVPALLRDLVPRFYQLFSFSPAASKRVAIRTKSRVVAASLPIATLRCPTLHLSIVSSRSNASFAKTVARRVHMHIVQTLSDD